MVHCQHIFDFQVYFKIYLYICFAILLIVGVRSRRRKYMLPMIVMTISLTVAAVGTVIVVTINVIEYVREERNNEMR